MDIFASAAKKDMDEADSQGLILSGARADFALNSVVLVVLADAKTGLNSFEGLNSAEIKKIAVGNPKSVPAGRYAEDVFTFYNTLGSIRDKFIYTENVRQVLGYVARNETDAGVVYATDAAARSKEVRVVAAAPEPSHKPVVYPLPWSRDQKTKPGPRPLLPCSCSMKAGPSCKNTVSNPANRTMESVDKNLINASYTLGHSEINTALKVILPLAKRICLPRKDCSAMCSRTWLFSLT